MSRDATDVTRWWPPCALLQFKLVTGDEDENRFERNIVQNSIFRVEYNLGFNIV